MAEIAQLCLEKYENAVKRLKIMFIRVIYAYRSNLTVNLRVTTDFMLESEIDKKRLFSPPINLYIKQFENTFIPDSQGDTRQNHLKMIEHEP